MPDFDNHLNHYESTEAVAVRVCYEYLRLSDDLVARLQAIKDNSRVAVTLLNLTNRVSSCVPNLVNNINMLGVSIDDPTKISYLNFGRIQAAYDARQTEKIWNDKNYRYHSSAGKVVRKLFDSIYVNTLQPNLGSLLCLIDEELIHRNGHRETEVVHDTIGKLFTEADYNEFNNLFRIEGFRQGDAGEVIYVKGHWIAHFYHEKNYASLSGTLGNSCMRYQRTQSFLDIYTHNPSVCKLAILLNKDGKLQGRALVWTVDDKDYYDRIYATSDLIQDRMKAFFLVKGLSTCFHGYSSYESIYLEGDSISLDVNKRVLLTHDQYPYMDSLKYLNEDHSILSNKESDMDGRYFILNDTSGRYEEYGGGTEECSCCGREAHVDDMCWIDVRNDDNHNQNLCDNCAIYSDYHTGYITRDDAAYVEYLNTWVLTSELTQDYNNEYIPTRDAVELIDGSYALPNDPDLVQYSDGDYFILGNDDYQYFEYNDEYYKPECCVETKDAEMVPEFLTIVDEEGQVWLRSEFEQQQNLNLI